MNLVSWHLWLLLEAGVVAGVVVALGAVVRWGNRRAARSDADDARCSRPPSRDGPSGR